MPFFLLSSVADPNPYEGSELIYQILICQKKVKEIINIVAGSFLYVLVL